MNHPTWNCDKKITARRDTIVRPYRDIFGRQAVPFQYWTLSGSYQDRQGNAVEGEFHKLEEEGLLKENQFHAVDISEKVISGNQLHYPNLNWHCGDFNEVMKSCKNYKPSIINYDSTSMPKLGVRYLSSLLMFLENNVDNELMVVSNMMLNTPYGPWKSSKEEVAELVAESHPFYADAWEVLPYCYEYAGTGRRSKTRMITILCIKNS